MKLLKSVICLIAAVSSTSGMCYNSSSQQFCVPDFDANWLGAAEHCNQLNMRFAVVNTPEKLKEVSSLGNTLKRTGIIKEHLWFGASDLTEHGKYVWHATGKRPLYTAWRQGEPNNWNNEEHCAYMCAYCTEEYPKNWLWNDGNCDEKHYFVCEKKPTE